MKSFAKIVLPAFLFFQISLVVQADDPSIPKRGAASQKPPQLNIGRLPVGKILFLGNSITLHGPAPQIGWTGNWGMAASKMENDYVHMLVKQISKECGGHPQIMVKNIAEFERKLTDYHLEEELKKELAFEPDVIIVALGENASSPKTDEDKKRFATAFSNLFSALKKRGQPAIFVRSQFWQDENKDRLLKQTSGDAGAVFVDIHQLGSDPANFARSERKIEHAGVGGHPGDKGMQALADSLWKAIQHQAELQKE